MTPELITKLKAARRVATPLIAVETSEPASAIRGICDAINGTAPCKLVWDCIRGAVPQSEESAAVLKATAEKMQVTGETITDISLAFCEPINALELTAHLPGESLVILQNSHRLFQGTPTGTFGIMQATWNLRDVLKSTGTTLVLLAPSHSLPVELTQDVTVMVHDLPSDADIAQTVTEVYAAAEIDGLPCPEILHSAQVALRGLNAFAVEQTAAESMRVTGLDMPGLWGRKKSLIEQSKAASFHTTGLRYSDIGGAQSVKAYFSALFSGPRRPELVVMIDEFDKQMAASDAQGDNGVGRDSLQVMLNQMVENDYPGAIFAGHPGTGKTVLTEAIAMEHGVPLLKADLAAVKGSLMGESEQGIRDFFRMIKGLTGGQSGGKALFIGCVNKMHDSIPPELRRRFTRRGVWFFDLPTAEERDAIWCITLQRFGLDCQPDQFPSDENWTGADIYNCVEIATALDISLAKAAAYLVPVAVSDPDSIAALRKSADNRWLSVSQDGPFQISSLVTNLPAVTTNAA
ncbi:MAG: AAA family ATPase, partial [Armatimonadota bacterium]